MLWTVAFVAIEFGITPKPSFSERTSDALFDIFLSPFRQTKKLTMSFTISLKVMCTCTTGIFAWLLRILFYVLRTKTFRTLWKPWLIYVSETIVNIFRLHILSPFGGKDKITKIPFNKIVWSTATSRIPEIKTFYTMVPKTYMTKTILMTTLTSTRIS